MPAFLLYIAKYWKLLVIAVIVGVAYIAGSMYSNNKCEREKIEIVARYNQLLQEEADRRYDISKNYEEQIQRIRSEVRTIVETVEIEVIKQPIYNECRLPDTGINLLNQTINKLNQSRQK